MFNKSRIYKHYMHIVLTANQQLTEKLQLGIDYGIRINKMTSVSTGGFTLQIKNVNDNIDYFNEPVPHTLCLNAKSDGSPIVYDIQAIANGMLQFIVKDTSGSGNTIDIYLEGEKLFTTDTVNAR